MKTLRQLFRSQCKELPDTPGVYVVITPKEFKPIFLYPGTGGKFKGKDPNVLCESLRSRWVPQARELYIGKANNLRQRVQRMLQFGCGRPVAKWGGRYIWQLKDSWNLLLWWEEHPSPELKEGRLLTDFERRHGRLPFANLRR